MAGSKDYPKAGDIVANRYRVERILGACPNSIVYGARHRLSGQSVAIRWWHSEERFVAMEWSEGESLKALLTREGPLSLRDIGRLMVPCMRRLHVLHRDGVSPLDLRTSKILVCRASRIGAERLQVFDFDIADRATNDALVELAAAKSRDSRAPEHHSEHASDQRADVYAFGAILHECLTGKVAAAATTSATETALVSRRDAALRISPESLPVGLAPILERAMAREPGDRFETLEAFADALEAYLSAPSGSFSPRRRSTATPSPDSLAYAARWNTVYANPSRSHTRAVSWRRWCLMGALCVLGVALWLAT